MQRCSPGLFRADDLEDLASLGSLNDQNNPANLEVVVLRLPSS
jgi:hypothetical protein